MNNNNNNSKIIAEYHPTQMSIKTRDVQFNDLEMIYHQVQNEKVQMSLKMSKEK